MFAHLFRKDEEPKFQCKQKPLFSESELLFFSRLQKILPTRVIFPQLHLSSLLSSKSGNPKNQQQVDQTDAVLNNLTLDFSVFNKELELLCVIELEQKVDQLTPVSTPSIAQCLKKTTISHIKWNKARLPNFEQMERLLAPFAEVNLHVLDMQNSENSENASNAEEQVSVKAEKESAKVMQEEVASVEVEEDFNFDISKYDFGSRLEPTLVSEETNNSNKDKQIKQAQSAEKTEHTHDSNNEDAKFKHLRKAPIIPAVDITIVKEHDNPNALSLRFLRDLTPQNFIQKEYPHIWHRICLFAEDPPRLNTYLDSLFVQNRKVKRQGLPLHVANEVILIKIENKHKILGSNDEDIWIGDAKKKQTQR